MGILALLRFLIGDAAAIKQVAQDRHALWFGLVFVLSAGFAREYDGEDLLAEPWHLLVPLGASLVASYLLFCIVWWASSGRPFAIPLPVAGSGYLSFLGVFWMTAPLAWLYAIPYDRFLSYEAAMDANVNTLAVVAVWRVLLLGRAVALCADLKPSAAAAAVIAFALAFSVAVSAAYTAMGRSVFDVMGGLRGTEEARYKGPAWLSLLPGMFICIFWPLWGLLAKLLWLGGTRGWLHRHIESAPPTRGLRWLAAVSLLVWVPILPITQPEQRNRRAYERAWFAGDVAKAAAILAVTPRERFPPHWLPPIGDREDQVKEMLAELRARDAPAWTFKRFLADPEPDE